MRRCVHLWSDTRVNVVSDMTRRCVYVYVYVCVSLFAIICVCVCFFVPVCVRVEMCVRVCVCLTCNEECYYRNCVRDYVRCCVRVMCERRFGT